MDKVTLPKEVAEAIEYGRTMGWLDGNILARTAKNGWESIEMKPLKEFVDSDSRLLLLASALLNGYEVEQTPEDKVRYEISKWSGLANDATDREDTCTANYWHAKVDATKKILDILNMQIKGVNA